jgi:GxxExxY protein
MKREYHENELSFLIRGAIFSTYNSLGPGLLESAYQAVLAHELIECGLQIMTEVGLPVIHKTVRLDTGYRIDILVEDKVLIEVKSVELIAPVHHKQLLTYLKLANKKLGILVNFNSADISASIIRKVNGLTE